MTLAGYCWDVKPGDVLRCTLPPLHRGDHKNVYAGETGRRGVRPGETWPRRSGETQAG